MIPDLRPRLARALRRAALPLALLPVLAASTPAAAAVGAEDEVERLEAWPAVEDEHQVELDVERLRKARTKEMGEQAHAGLVAAGAGVVPELLTVFAREKDEDAVERIEAVLLAVTGAAHTRLLARSFEDESDRVRCFALARVAAFPDRGVRPQASAALERARARVAKEKKPKKGSTAREEAYRAALCCAASGSVEGLEELVERAADGWKKSGAEIRVALEAVRSPEATALVAPVLKEEARERRVAALRVLAGCGDEESATGIVAPFLDSSDNTLRVAAINALRGIVDGEPPLDKLAVFEAIERAGAWKKRL